MKTELNELVSQEFKEEFNVLNKNETRRERIWKDCVKEAKILVKVNDETRLKIVLLAEKCCVIHHGGKYTNERFTIVRFAQEIGMPEKTLYDWIRLKKNVYDNLPSEVQKIVTNKQMISIDQKTRNIPKKTEAYKKAITETHKQVTTSNESTQKMQEYVKRLKSLLFNVKNKAMIRHVDQEVLIEILHLSREVSWNLKYLDEKEK